MPHIELPSSVWTGPSYIEIGHPSGILWEADFTRLPLSDASNATMLRSALAARGLTLTRASAATVQTSASTVVTSGIGVDDPRVGDAGYGRGLVVEESRTNQLLQCRDRASGSWTAGTGTVTDAYAAGPDGTVVDRQVCASGQFGNYQSPAVSSSTSYVLTQWARRGVVGVASSLGHYLQDATTATFASASHALADTWERYTNATLATGPATVATTASCCEGRAIGGLSASARDAVVDLAQVEAGKFATEAILTTGAAAARAADELTQSMSRVTRSGRFGLELRLVPKASRADYGSTRYLFSALQSPFDQVTINTLGQAVFYINSATYTTASGMTWSAGDVLDVWIEGGGGSLVSRAVYRVNGGAAVVLGSSGAPQAAVQGTTLGLLGAAGSAVLTSWLQRIRAYAPGRRPAWAA